MSSYPRLPAPLALLLLYATSGLLWGVWIQRLPASI
jgi:hypothetical protein